MKSGHREVWGKNETKKKKIKMQGHLYADTFQFSPIA